jgi:hypothetical protein
MSTLIAADTLRPTRTQAHTLQVDSVGLVEVTSRTATAAGHSCCCTAAAA